MISAGERATSADPSWDTTLFYTRCPVPTASSLAIQRGLLAEEFRPDGLTVASVSSVEQRSVQESHFDHSLANLFREGGVAPPIWTRSRGADIRLVAVTWIDQFQAVLALPGSGIKAPSDLRGRRLAVPRRANDQIDHWRVSVLHGFGRALMLAGVDERDVTFVDLPIEGRYIPDRPGPERPGPERQASRGDSLWSAVGQQERLRREAFALIRGEVDAIFVIGARGAQLAAFLGADTVVDLGSQPERRMRVTNSTPAVLTVSGELLRRRRDLVVRYLRCAIASARWAETHRAEAGRIVASEIGFSEDWVDLAHPDLHRQLMPSLDADALAAISGYKDFMLQRGIIEADFAVDEWVDPDPLAEALRESL
ncbi:MAG: ABC transporter substrate-binding protein [Chloroflexota bacterium]